MPKVHVAQANARLGIHVARDSRPASVSIKRAVARQARTASRETAAIKAKRPANCGPYYSAADQLPLFELPWWATGATVPKYDDWYDDYDG